MSSSPEAQREARARRLAYVKEHLACPYCEKPLERWDCGSNPMAQSAAEFVYVCVNHECPYFQESLQDTEGTGRVGGSYCFVYDPSRDWCGPMAARRPPTPRG